MSKSKDKEMRVKRNSPVWAGQSCVLNPCQRLEFLIEYHSRWPYISADRPIPTYLDNNGHYHLVQPNKDLVDGLTKRWKLCKPKIISTQ